MKVIFLNKTLKTYLPIILLLLICSLILLIFMQNEELVLKQIFSQNLFRSKVLCMVTTTRSSINRALAVKATWGSRCDILLFISDTNDPELPSIKVCDIEDRDHLWCKTKRGFKYVYDLYYDQADWFMKADDDAYYIMDNLKHFLSKRSPFEPVFFGNKFKINELIIYMSGGSGYVLSKEALRRFIKYGISNYSNPNLCKKDDDTGTEDAEMGKCLVNNGVIHGDTRDDLKKSRFFSLEMKTFMNPSSEPLLLAPWYKNYSFYPFDEHAVGFNCCSTTSIAFHYIQPEDMYVYDFLLYHLKVMK